MATQKRFFYFIVGLLIVGLAAGSFMSCTDFFSTTWADWAKRETIAAKVTPANVRDLIDQAQGNPAWSLDILKKIGDAVNDPTLTPEQKSILRAAALDAAVNASDIASSLLKGMGEILDAASSDDTGGVSGILSSLTGNMKNLDEISGALNAIFPPDMNTESDEFKGFVEESDAEGLALSALILIAVEATKAEQDLGEYISDFNPADPPPNLTLVVKLADGAVSKLGDDNPLGDIVGGLTTPKKTNEDEKE
jgi:hypothetical protein